MKLIKMYILIFALINLIAIQSWAGENRKLAQTGMKFLSAGTDAHAAGLSNALVARDFGAASLFYNPAGMARMDGFLDVSFSKMTFIADFNYISAALAFSPQGGAWGVFGITMLSVDYGDFYGTIRAENEQGFLDIGTFTPAASSFGLGYAKYLTNKFSVGGQIKIANLDLTGGLNNFETDQQGNSKSYKQNVMAYDFGILYRTGFKSLSFGMNVRNFSEEIHFIEENFPLPLQFETGLSMDLVDLTSFDPAVHSLLLSVDATHPRDYPEQIDFGLEYGFYKMFMLRAGYTTPTDEQGLSLGLGLNTETAGYNVGINYSYTTFGIFDDIHRFTFQFGM